MSLEALAQRWRADLESWAIPQPILDQAPEPPWSHPVELFAVQGDIPDSPSHSAAREALASVGSVLDGSVLDGSVLDGSVLDGSVLDIGCGGGRAAFAIAAPGTEVIGVDHQAGMLEQFAAEAERRGLAHQEVEGYWPAAADRSPIADVVTCHHVAYNVADIVPFLTALNAYARRRVVIEVPTTHPMQELNPLWLALWGLERPRRPTAGQLLDLVQALWPHAQMQIWTDPSWGRRTPMSTPMSTEDQLRHLRRRLCLTPDRDAELAAALAEAPAARPRELATIWWDPRS